MKKWHKILFAVLFILALAAGVIAIFNVKLW